MKNKIAIRVSNKREFDALMKHYESKRWKYRYSNEPIYDAHNVKVDLIVYEDNYECFSIGNREVKGYTYLNFSTFAQIAGIGVKDEIVVELTGAKAIVGKEEIILQFSSDYFPMSAAEFVKLTEAYQSLQ